MKATGEINIDEAVETADVVLSNPTMEVVGVSIQVLFTSESGKKHGRTILIDADKNNKLIKDSIKNHDLLSQFK